MGKRGARMQRHATPAKTGRVVDDFSRAHCNDPPELDAIEAFLMPQLNAILSGETNGGARIPTAQRQGLTSAVVSCAREG
jgi:hypothetical protein